MLRILIFWVWLSGTAFAGQLYLHTLSQHIPDNSHAVEFNYGVGYKFDSNIRLGGYRNSYGMPSWYATYVFRPDRRVHPWLGVITGYTLHGGKKLDPDSTGIGGKRNSMIPLVALEIDLPFSCGLILTPGLAHLELRY